MSWEQDLMDDQRRLRLQNRLAQRRRELGEMPETVGLFSRWLGGQEELDMKRIRLTREVGSLERELEEADAQRLPSALQGDALKAFITSVTETLQTARCNGDAIDSLWEPAHTLFDAIGRLGDPELELRSSGLLRRCWVVDEEGFDELRADLLRLATDAASVGPRQSPRIATTDRFADSRFPQLREQLWSLRMSPPQPGLANAIGPRGMRLALSDPGAALRLRAPALQIEALATEHGDPELIVRAERARGQAASVDPGTWGSVVREWEAILDVIESDVQATPPLEAVMASLERAGQALAKMEQGYTSVAMTAVRELEAANDSLSTVGIRDVVDLEALAELRVWAIRDAPPDAPAHAETGWELHRALLAAAVEAGASPS